MPLTEGQLLSYLNSKNLYCIATFQSYSIQGLKDAVFYDSLKFSSCNAKMVVAVLGNHMQTVTNRNI